MIAGISVGLMYYVSNDIKQVINSLAV